MAELMTWITECITPSEGKADGMPTHGKRHGANQHDNKHLQDHRALNDEVGWMRELREVAGEGGENVSLLMETYFSSPLLRTADRRQGEQPW